ncbi:MAG: hypothetical protein ACTSVI_10595, partial [Promethearchaeota archaeon]
SKYEIQIDDLKSQLKQYSEKVGQADVLNSKVEEMRAEFSKEKERLLNLLNESNQKIETLAKEISTLSEDKKVDLTTIDSLHKEIEALKKENSILQEKNSMISSKCEQLERELESSSEVDDSLLADIDKREKEYQDKIDDLEKALGDALETTMKYSALEEELKEAKAEKEKHEKEIEKYKRRIEELKTEIQEKQNLEDQVKDLKIQLKEMRRKLRKFEEA